MKNDKPQCKWCKSTGHQAPEDHPSKDCVKYVRRKLQKQLIKAEAELRRRRMLERSRWSG